MDLGRMLSSAALFPSTWCVRVALHVWLGVRVCSSRGVPISNRAKGSTVPLVRWPLSFSTVCACVCVTMKRNRFGRPGLWQICMKDDSWYCFSFVAMYQQLKVLQGVERPFCFVLCNSHLCSLAKPVLVRTSLQIILPTSSTLVESKVTAVHLYNED